jgi:hypothetical protein
MQVNDIAVLITEDLNFDVLRVRNVFLKKDGGISKSAFRFRLRFIEQAGQIAGFLNHAHAATAAAKCGFDDQGEANFLRGFQRFTAIRNGFFVTRQNRNLDFLRERAGGGFVAHHVEKFRPRPNERDPSLGAGAGELGILGKKSVAWMNRIDTFFLRDRDDAFDVEIRSHRTFSLTDKIRFIGFEAMQAKAIFLRVNGDGAQVQFGSSAKNPNGDFAAIGSEKFLERTDRAAGRDGTA